MGLSRGEQLTDRVEDKSEGQVMDDTGRKPSIAGDLASVRAETFALKRTDL